MKIKDYWIDKQYLNRIFYTKDDFADWFGYYNYDVINSDGTRILCNRATFDGRAITEEDTIELGWYDLRNSEWNRIGYTDSFNWQQGAMLQWLPQSRSTVIYNRSFDGHFQSVIFNTDTKEERTIEYPIYCIHPSGEYAITLNYERSYWCRAYHYQSVVNEKYNVRIAEDDGVYKINLNDGKIERIISITDIVSLDSIPEFLACKHWLEHVMINPSGTRLAVLHRFTTADGYGTRVITAKIDGGGLSVVEGWKNHDYSHLGWISDDSFAIYSVVRLSPYCFKSTVKMGINGKECKTKEPYSIVVKKKIRKIISPRIIDKFRGRKKGYDIFKLNGLKFEYFESLNQNIFCIDGHPSFTKDGCFMITDTYPDKNGIRKLIIYDVTKEKDYVVGMFYSPLRNTPAACDLHPKLCYQDKVIVVDTACLGKHNMFAFEINWQAIKKNEGK